MAAGIIEAKYVTAAGDTSLIIFDQLPTLHCDDFLQVIHTM